MEVVIRILKKIDDSLEVFEKWFSGIGLLIITALVLLGVFLRTVFSFTFTWLEEICQYLMVWIACIGCVLSVKKDEHVGVDVIFSVMPKKFHPKYKMVLTFINAAFIIFFTRFSLDLMLKVQKTGQTSVSMPWLQMYVLYLGVVIGNVLLLYEYIKLFVRRWKSFLTDKKTGNISAKEA